MLAYLEIPTNQALHNILSCYMVDTGPNVKYLETFYLGKILTRQSSCPTVGVLWVGEASSGIVEVATNPNMDRGSRSRPCERKISSDFCIREI